MSLKIVLPAIVIVVASIWVVGCAKSAGNPAPATQVDMQSHGDDGWWCNEHGIPEEVCALCNVKLVADFKAKGDWCQQHDRPDSQCFVCHPEKGADFAAQYEAKYGTKPPRPHADNEKPE